MERHKNVVTAVSSPDNTPCGSLIPINPAVVRQASNLLLIGGGADDYAICPERGWPTGSRAPTMAERLKPVNSITTIMTIGLAVDGCTKARCGGEFSQTQALAGTDLHQDQRQLRHQGQHHVRLAQIQAPPHNLPSSIAAKLTSAAKSMYCASQDDSNDGRSLTRFRTHRPPGSALSPSSDRLRLRFRWSRFPSPLLPGNGVSGKASSRRAAILRSRIQAWGFQLQRRLRAGLIISSI